MRCPVCNSREVSVVDTRSAGDDLSIRRRRECEKCGYRFSTVEETELLDVVVVKKDGRRESYMREKVENGIKRSLTKRAYSQENFHRIINSIEKEIQKKKKREIKSEEIGEIILRQLKTFDKVAYVRYASVYRDFKDVKSFAKELKKLGRR